MGHRSEKPSNGRKREGGEGLGGGGEVGVDGGGELGQGWLQIVCLMAAT